MSKLTASAARLLELGRKDASARGQSIARAENVLLSALDMGPDGPLGAAYGERGFAAELRAKLEADLSPVRALARQTGLAAISDGLEMGCARLRRARGQVDTHGLLEVALEAWPKGSSLGVSASMLLENAYDVFVSTSDLVPLGDPEPTVDASSSLLERHGRDLTRAAKEGLLQPALGREREIESVCASLLRSRQNNPLLIGFPGTGKTAIVEQLALEMARGSLGAELGRARLVEIDLPGLVAGTRYRGDFEARLEGLIAEVRAAPDPIVLFVDEIHLLVGAGAVGGAMDAGNILKPPLARGQLRLIGATTPEEYRRTIAKDGALARRFAAIDVRPPDAEATVEILDGIRDRLADHHGIPIERADCELAVRLAERYVRQRHFPDKAILVLDQAASLQRVLQPGVEGKRGLGPGAIHAAVERLTGVPAERLAKKASERLETVLSRLDERIVGQPRAIEAVMRTLRRRAAALAPEDRPIGSFLFLGPSGVGKTELARVLAEEYFDAPDALERFDMSEYAGRAGGASLLGAPSGTVGSDRGGALTNALTRNPHAVYLFDEIEKADKATLNLFLQMLDAGRLTARDGTVVDCTQAIVIFTSNLGQEALRAVEGAPDARAEAQLEAARSALPVELFRRFDEVVAFSSLDVETSARVASLLLRRLSGRFQRAHGFPLRFDEGVSRELGRLGHSELYGARNLRHALERRVEGPLVDWLLGQSQLSAAVRGSWSSGSVRFETEEVAGCH